MNRYNTRFSTKSRAHSPADDADYVPLYDAQDDDDSFTNYVAAQRVVSRDDLLDEDYSVNLGDWNVSMGRRPVTRSMTRDVAVTTQSRVMTLRSSRR